MNSQVHVRHVKWNSFSSFFSLETPSGTISPLATPIVVPPKPLTSRQQVALELLQTEKNYVEILTNILKVISH